MIRILQMSSSRVFFSLALFVAGLAQSAEARATATSMPCDSLNLKKEEKAKSVGNWRGFSASTVSMIQFQGNMEDYDASLGARDGLGIVSGDVTQSWRVEFNPFEKRQRVLGEFIGLTTGLGFDWWRFGVDDLHRLQFEDASNSVTAEVLSPDSMQVTKNHVNAVYIRIPLLASLHTYKRGGNGFHLEAGVVGGFLLHGEYIFEQQNLSIHEYKREDFPINPFQLHGRMAIGFGKMSLLGEVSLLPFFDESPLDTPGMHSFSVGLQFRFSD